MMRLGQSLMLVRKAGSREQGAGRKDDNIAIHVDDKDGIDSPGFSTEPFRWPYVQVFLPICLRSDERSYLILLVERNTFRKRILTSTPGLSIFLHPCSDAEYCSCSIFPSLWLAFPRMIQCCGSIAKSV